MKEFIKAVYYCKIRMMFYFTLGYGEVNGLAMLGKDIAILLGFAVVVFKIHLDIIQAVGIGVGSFLLFIIIGVILKATGMSDYTSKLGNSINPELKLVRKIAKHLGVEE